MKKTLLSVLSIITISFTSMAQIIGPDVQVTEIIEPASSVTAIAGNSTVDVNFTFEVVADTLHTGDSSLVFSALLDSCLVFAFRCLESQNNNQNNNHQNMIVKIIIISAIIIKIIITIIIIISIIIIVIMMIDDNNSDNDD